MSKIIAIANQKGGVGKTTTSVNLSAGLGMLGRKVLLVDIDPQGNATSGVGVDKRATKHSTYDIFVEGLSGKDAVGKTQFNNLDIIDIESTKKENKLNTYFFRKNLALGDEDNVSCSCYCNIF